MGNELGQNKSTGEELHTPAPEAKDYNPLMESVNEKVYSKPNINPTIEQLNTPISAPTFQPAPASGGDFYQNGGNNNNNSGNQQKQQAPPSINPAMEMASDEEKKAGAKQLAKIAIDTYAELKSFANKGLQFPEKKLTKLVAEGDINMSIPIPFDLDQTITVADFVREHNESTKNTFRVSPEFRKEVTPVLERVLEKRGAGLTDEQTLIYLFGKDIAITTIQFVSIRKNMSDMIEMMKNMTEAAKDGHVAQHNPPPPPPPPHQNSAGNSYGPVNSPASDFSTGSGNQHYEPEEKQQYQQQQGQKMPEFGDPEILKNLEEIEKKQRGEKKSTADYFSKTKYGRANKIEDAQVVEVTSNLTGNIPESNPLD